MANSNDWTIYHNPQCSKSRVAMTYLNEKGVEAHVVEYVKAPPDAATLRDLLKKLKLGARDILRDSEDEYGQLMLSDANLTDDALIEAMVEHPILIQRPIVIRGDRAVVGRPTEAIDALLD